MIDEELNVEITVLLLGHFDHDETKVSQWLASPNPNLGGYVPYELMMVGRGEKVYMFVKAMLDGY